MKLGTCFFFIACTLSRGLAYPYGLEVHDVEAESVVLKWQTTETNVQEFKVQCSGIRHYLTAQNEPRTEIAVNAITHFVPGAVTQILMGDVQPNFNYSCMISEELADNAQVLESKISNPFHFSTDYSSPMKPKTPEVIPHGEHYRINLFPVSSIHGPLLGYKIQFHVVRHFNPDEKALINNMWIVPNGELAPIEPQAAALSHEPKAFQLSFAKDSLPKYIQTDSELFADALKTNSKYSVIIIAFALNKEQMKKQSKDMLYTLYTGSEPSMPFVAKTHIKHHHTPEEMHTIHYHTPAVETPHSHTRPRQLALAISLGVILPCLIIGWVILVAVCLLCRTHRIRKQQHKTFFQNYIKVEAMEPGKAHDGELISSDALSILDGPCRSHSNKEHALSTPTMNISPLPIQQIQSSKSLIQFSPDHSTPTKSLKKHIGLITSEPVQNHTSYYHMDNSKSNILQYTTTVDTQSKTKSPEAKSPETENANSPRSPAFFSASEFSGPEAKHEELRIKNSSSSMFLPRGLSAGPHMPTVPLAIAPELSPVQQLLTQLSEDLGESGQEDQAPDLEMDLYEISIT